MKFLKADLVIQRILGIAYLGLGFLGIGLHSLLLIVLLIQVVIGIWQVLSAIIHLVRGDRNRLPYLLSVAIYFVLMVLTTALMQQNMIPESMFLFVFGIILIPLGLAIWSYIITLKAYNHLLEHPRKDTDLNMEMDDILDSGELSQ